MSDLVERLRRWQESELWKDCALFREAADEIERLHETCVEVTEQIGTVECMKIVSAKEQGDD